MSATYTPVIWDFVLEGDTSVSGYYPSDNPLQSVQVIKGTGTEERFIGDLDGNFLLSSSHERSLISAIAELFIHEKDREQALVTGSAVLTKTEVP